MEPATMGFPGTSCQRFPFNVESSMFLRQHGTIWVPWHAIDRGDIGSEPTSSSGSGSELLYSLMEYWAGIRSNQLATVITLITQTPLTQAWSTQLKSMYAGVPW